MDHAHVLLTETEEMWAKMLMQVLKDNAIPCTAIPVYGAGVVLKTGVQERFQVYVPSSSMPKAQELLSQLFSGNNT